MTIPKYAVGWGVSVLLKMEKLPQASSLVVGQAVVRP